jgi:hypothetical protein
MADGTLIVGRGVPNSWLASGQSIDLANFPTTEGHRVGLGISSIGDTVTLHVTGTPSGPIVFDLPAFVNNISGASAGTVDESAGTVTIPAGTQTVTVGLHHLQPTPAQTSLRVDPPGAVHVGAGGSTTLSATFADDGPGALSGLQLALHAPAGWKVVPVGSSAAANVEAGTTVSGQWLVTAPAGRGTRTARLDAVATFTDATTGRPETTAVAELGPPGISRLSATTDAGGETITVYGSGFGPSQGTSSALALTDGATTWSAPGNLPALTVLHWTDKQITFEIPTPSGTAGDQYELIPATTATLQVVTAGGTSNTVPLGIS